jgi:hypothetical protein
VVATATHRSGALATLAVLPDAGGSYGVIHAYGTDENRVVHLTNTYPAFRGQLLAVVEWLLSGRDPYPFEETIELMAVIIAGLESREHGRAVSVARLREEVEALAARL